MRRFWIAVLAVLLAAGCTAPDARPDAGSPATAAAHAGCSRAIGAGADRTLSFPVDPSTAEGAHERTALVHVPAGYQPDSPYPVLLVYHGHGGNSADAAASTGFLELADREGFLAVYPQGLPDGHGGPPMWASAGPVDHGIAELPATRTLLDNLAATYCVDPTRVYATGMSNGGGMANYLACGLADRITAIAPVVGNMYDPKDGGCRPTRPVSILDVHAVDDPVVGYEGSTSDPAWHLPPVSTWLAGWATLNHCSPESAVPVDTPAEQRRQWTGCAGGASIIAYRVTGGHRWPDTLDGAPAASVIWSFLAGHRMR
ncbi:alpha/beta hydrolase family esterase [Dactylosporangium sp. NPDC048998]|uniref:alpha/beta hydrolase family esterase n=1 Tax=Dactylosporangium sp. NPDC048998 TaxID=3363976 RepID=UPI0037108A3E